MELDRPECKYRRRERPPVHDPPIPPAVGVQPLIPSAQDAEGDAVLHQASVEFLRQVGESQARCGMEVEGLRTEAEALRQQRDTFLLERDRAEAAKAAMQNSERHATAKLEEVNCELTVARQELAAVKREHQLELEQVDRERASLHLALDGQRTDQQASLAAERAMLLDAVEHDRKAVSELKASVVTRSQMLDEAEATLKRKEAAARSAEESARSKLEEQGRLLSEREVKIGIAEEAAARVFAREKSLVDLEENLKDREIAVHKGEMELQAAKREVDALMSRHREESQQLAADRQLFEEQRLALDDAVQVQTEWFQKKESDLLASIEEVEKGCQEKISEVASRETEARHTLASLESSISDAKQHLKSLEEEACASRSQLKEICKQVDDAEIARDRASRAAAEAEGELEKVRSSANQETKTNKRDLENIKEEHMHLEEAVSALHKEKENLKAEIEDGYLRYEREKEDLEAYIHSKQSEMESEQRQLEQEFEELIHRHETQVKEWEHQVAEQQARMIRQQAEIDAEQARLKSMGDDLLAREKEVSQLRAQQDHELAALRESLDHDTALARDASAAAASERIQLQHKANELMLEEKQLEGLKQQVKASALSQLQERETILHDWELQVARRQKEMDEIQTNMHREIENRERAVNETLAAAEKRLADVEAQDMQFRKVQLEKEAELHTLERDLSSLQQDLIRRAAETEELRVRYQQGCADAEKAQGDARREHTEACRLRHEAERMKQEAQATEEGLKARDAKLGDLEAKLARAQDALVEKTKGIADAIQAASMRESAACEKENAAQSGLSAILSWEKQKDEEEGRLEKMMLEVREEKAQVQKLLEAVQKEKEGVASLKTALTKVESTLEAREHKLQESWSSVKRQLVDLLKTEQEGQLALAAMDSTPVSNFRFNCPNALNSASPLESAAALEHFRAQLLQRETDLQRWAVAIEVQAAKHSRGEQRIQDVEAALLQREEELQRMQESHNNSAQQLQYHSDALEKWAHELEAAREELRVLSVQLEERSKHIEQQLKEAQDSKNENDVMRQELCRDREEADALRKGARDEYEKAAEAVEEASRERKRMDDWEGELRRREDEVSAAERASAEQLEAVKSQTVELQQRWTTFQNLESEQKELAEQKKALESIMEETRKRSQKFDIQEAQMQLQNEKIASEWKEIEMRNAEARRLEEKEESLNKKARFLESEEARLGECEADLESRQDATQSAESRILQEHAELDKRLEKIAAAEALAEENLKQAVVEAERQLNRISEDRRNLEQNQAEFRRCRQNACGLMRNSALLVKKLSRKFEWQDRRLRKSGEE
eukprot:evm.model.scf_189EXC.7 EVM.evm.TU.scf_189EXC.7   scf_189EXC:65340-79685(-)